VSQSRELKERARSAALIAAAKSFITCNTFSMRLLVVLQNNATPRHFMGPSGGLKDSTYNCKMAYPNTPAAVRANTARYTTDSMAALNSVPAQLLWNTRRMAITV
jgi:hypothetical protein